MPRSQNCDAVEIRDGHRRPTKEASTLGSCEVGAMELPHERWLTSRKLEDMIDIDRP